METPPNLTKLVDALIGEEEQKGEIEINKTETEIEGNKKGNNNLELKLDHIMK